MLIKQIIKVIFFRCFSSILSNKGLEENVSQQQFPHDLKVADGLPVFKKEDPFIIRNYKLYQEYGLICGINSKANHLIY